MLNHAGTNGLRHMFVGCLLYLAMSRPSFVHAGTVWSSFTSRAATAKQILRLSPLVLKNLDMEFPIFGIMSGPGLDHVGIKFALTLVLDQLQL